MYFRIEANVLFWQKTSIKKKPIKVNKRTKKESLNLHRERSSTDWSGNFWGTFQAYNDPDELRRKFNSWQTTRRTFLVPSIPLPLTRPLLFLLFAEREIGVQSPVINELLRSETTYSATPVLLGLVHLRFAKPKQLLPLAPASLPSPSLSLSLLLQS